MEDQAMEYDQGSQQSLMSMFDNDLKDPGLDDLVERLISMADNAIRVERWLGRIVVSTPYEFKDRYFLNRVITTKYVLQMKVACPIDSDVYSYDPWSKDWLDHLGPRLASCSIVKETESDDQQVATLLDAMRICSINEKPNTLIPIPPEDDILPQLYYAPSDPSFNELATQPTYKRYTTRK